jgi:hypothetical protein
MVGSSGGETEQMSACISIVASHVAFRRGHGRPGLDVIDRTALAC